MANLYFYGCPVGPRGWVVGAGAVELGAVSDLPDLSTRAKLTILQLFHAELGVRLISTTDSDIPGPLPPQLRRVLPLLLRGWNIDDISQNLGLSPYTVREYTQYLYRYFGIHRRHERPNCSGMT